MGRDMRLSVRPLKARELPGAADLISRSWAADYSQEGYFAYSPELLRHQYKEEEGSVWFGAFRKGDMLGVNASLPRWLSAGGQFL